MNPCKLRKFKEGQYVRLTFSVETTFTHSGEVTTFAASESIITKIHKFENMYITILFMNECVWSPHILDEIYDIEPATVLDHEHFMVQFKISHA